MNWWRNFQRKRLAAMERKLIEIDELYQKKHKLYWDEQQRFNKADVSDSYRGIKAPVEQEVWQVQLFNKRHEVDKLQEERTMLIHSIAGLRNSLARE